MANKWKTAVADALWVKEAYNNDPQNPSAKVLVRAIYGVSKDTSAGIIDTLNATKSVVNPYVDGAALSGTFRVIKTECRPSSEGNLHGSDVIIQTLGAGFFTTLSTSNGFVLKDQFENEEQNENAWMYYERGTRLETTRWVNLSYAGAEDLFPYTSSVAFTHAPASGTYETPVIRECWYEKEQDGSYSIYRTLFARATTAAMKTRSVQYAGMLITNTVTPPAEGDSSIVIAGFSNQTEVVYANSKFSIGGDTYRVTANATAVAGSVTVNIVPEITAATDALCDNLEDAPIQIYFEALS